MKRKPCARGVKAWAWKWDGSQVDARYVGQFQHHVESTIETAFGKNVYTIGEIVRVLITALPRERKGGRR